MATGSFAETGRWSSCVAARCRASRARSTRGTRSVDLLSADALLVALDHLADQLLDVAVPARPNVPVLDGLDVVANGALGSQLVEVRAGNCDRHPGVLRRGLADLRPWNLDPEHLDVPASTELQLEDQLEL